MTSNLIVCSEAVFKQCSKCREIKPLHNFIYISKAQRYDSKCKSCEKKYQIEYNIKHKAIIKQKQKEYRIKNIEKFIANRDEYNKQNREYYQNNKETYKKKHSEYHKNNKDWLNPHKRIYAKEHKEQINKRNQKRNKIRMQTDPTYKVKILMRNSSKKFITKGGKVDITCRTRDLLCKSAQEVRCHLEKQFRDGMTWENHGVVWHIDHIIPLDFFNQSDLTERKLANHWGNLQPLLVAENLLKSNNVPEKMNFKY